MVTIQRSQSKLTVSFCAFTLFLLPSYTCRAEHKYLNFHLSPNRIWNEKQIYFEVSLKVPFCHFLQYLPTIRPRRDTGREQNSTIHFRSRSQIFVFLYEMTTIVGRENYTKPYSGNKQPIWRHYIRKDCNTRLSPPQGPQTLGIMPSSKFLCDVLITKTI